LPRACHPACANASSRLLRQDFYTAKKPEFDVLVTNPPFTRDHLPRAFAFAFACGRPFLLLAPQYCARKDWFLAAVAAAPRAARPAFLGPTGAPYVFAAPAALAAVRAKRGASQEGDTIAVPAGKCVRQAVRTPPRLRRLQVSELLVCLSGRTAPEAGARLVAASGATRLRAGGAARGAAAAGGGAAAAAVGEAVAPQARARGGAAACHRRRRRRR